MIHVMCIARRLIGRKPPPFRMQGVCLSDYQQYWKNLGICIHTAPCFLHLLMSLHGIRIMIQYLLWSAQQRKGSFCASSTSQGSSMRHLIISQVNMLIFLPGVFMNQSLGLIWKNMVSYFLCPTIMGQHSQDWGIFIMTAFSSRTGTCLHCRLLWNHRGVLASCVFHWRTLWYGNHRHWRKNGYSSFRNMACMSPIPWFQGRVLLRHTISFSPMPFTWDSFFTKQGQMIMLGLLVYDHNRATWCFTICNSFIDGIPSCMHGLINVLFREDYIICLSKAVLEVFLKGILHILNEFRQFPYPRQESIQISLHPPCIISIVVDGMAEIIDFYR